MPKHTVLKEYDSVEGYRIRVIRTKRGVHLDIREHVTSEGFTGFTKAGISIHKPETIKSLMSSLAHAFQIYFKD